MANPIEKARAFFSEGRIAEAEAALESAVSSAPDARTAAAAALVALKAGQPQLAARFYARAQQFDPRDPEHPHDRGLALLEAGEVGLAAQAQAQALALDPEHLGARAQRAAALEALGDDEGAAGELSQVLRRTGPHLTFQARLSALREKIALASRRRLMGAPGARVASSHVVGTTFVRQARAPGAIELRAPFASLQAALDAGGRVSRLSILFDDMEASLQRSDLGYGGTVEDEHGRRVPLDEFTSAGTVFLSDALGIDPTRARRVLKWLLTAEAGRGPHRVAGALVSWLIVEEQGRRRYGLLVEEAPELV